MLVSNYCTDAHRYASQHIASAVEREFSFVVHVFAAQRTPPKRLRRIDISDLFRSSTARLTITYSADPVRQWVKVLQAKSCSLQGAEVAPQLRPLDPGLWM